VVTVTAVNDEPVASDVAAVIAEGTPNGTIVATIPVTDIDLPPDTLSFTITAGNDDGVFDIDIATGEIELVDAGQLDYTITPTYVLTVEVDDGNGGSDTATATIDIVGERLSATLTDTLGSDNDGDLVPGPGDTMVYTLTVTNGGTTASAGIVYTDLATDTGLSLIGGTVSTSQGSVILGAGATDTVVLVDIGSVAAGDSVVVTYEAQVAGSLPPGVGEVLTQGVISGAVAGPVLTDDPDLPGTTDPTRTPMAASPVVAVTKAATLLIDADGDSLVSPGDTLEYRIDIGNAGSETAQGVIVVDPMTDPKLTLQAGSVTTTTGSIVDGNDPSDTAVLVAIGDLPGAGGNATVTFQAAVANPFPAGAAFVQNQAATRGGNFVAVVSDDPATAAPADATVVAVEGVPSITVDKAAVLLLDGDGDGLAAPGDTLHYTITVSNTGNANTGPITIEDALADPNLELVPGSVTSSSGSVVVGASPGDVSVVVEVADLAGAGGSVVVDFDARIALPVAAGTTEVINAALVRAGAGDVWGPPVSVAVEAGPNLAVTKVDQGDAVGAGSAIDYTITYRNDGTQAATGVVITETVPPHTTFAAGPGASGWSCTDGAPAGTACSLVVGDLPVGAEGVATFGVVVDPGLPISVASIENTVSVADDGSGGPDANPSDNTFTLSRPVGAAAIEGYLWIDLDQDGARGADEDVLEGVVVELTRIDSGNLVTTATTDVTGRFGFPDLGAGDFLVNVRDVTVPAGLVLDTATASLAGAGTGAFGVITLETGQVWRVEYGFVGTGRLAGRVWNDVNGNGMIDTGEPGLGGAQVELVASGGDGVFGSADDLALVEVTDTNGDYEFAGLLAGSYEIDVLPTGMSGGANSSALLPLRIGLAPGVDIGKLNIGFSEPADLAIRAVVLDAARPASELVYRIDVENAGPAPAGTTTVTALLPFGFVLDSAAGPGWACSNSAQLTCVVDGIAIGETRSIIIEGRVSAADRTLTIVAVVTSLTHDPDLNNNQTAVSSGLGELPRTGVDADRLGGAGAVLLGLGLILVLLAAVLRRREDEEPER
jgi:uncharacterized repeat protein (TIGR01451 family)